MHPLSHARLAGRLSLPEQALLRIPPGHFPGQGPGLVIWGEEEYLRDWAALCRVLPAACAMDGTILVPEGGRVAVVQSTLTPMPPAGDRAGVAVPETNRRYDRLFRQLMDQGLPLVFHMTLDPDCLVWFEQALAIHKPLCVVHETSTRDALVPLVGEERLLLLPRPVQQVFFNPGWPTGERGERDLLYDGALDFLETAELRNLIPESLARRMAWVDSRFVYTLQKAEPLNQPPWRFEGSISRDHLPYLLRHYSFGLVAGMSKLSPATRHGDALRYAASGLRVVALAMDGHLPGTTVIRDAKALPGFFSLLPLSEEERWNQCLELFQRGHSFVHLMERIFAALGVAYQDLLQEMPDITVTWHGPIDEEQQAVFHAACQQLGSLARVRVGETGLVLDSRQPTACWVKAVFQQAIRERDPVSLAQHRHRLLQAVLQAPTAQGWDETQRRWIGYGEPAWLEACAAFLATPARAMPPVSQPSPVVACGPLHFQEKTWHADRRAMMSEVLASLARQGVVHWVTGPVPDSAREEVTQICQTLGLRHEAPVRLSAGANLYKEWTAFLDPLLDQWAPRLVTNLFGVVALGRVLGELCARRQIPLILRLQEDEMASRLARGNYAAGSARHFQDQVDLQWALLLARAVLVTSPWQRQQVIRHYWVHPEAVALLQNNLFAFNKSATVFPPDQGDCS